MVTEVESETSSICLPPQKRGGAEPTDSGIKALRHWRQDIVAGLVVALVSVPLSLGIALASGAPPIAGLTSEIIAGLVFPFLGGAYVTISGPAAGLTPVLFAAIAALGHGDMSAGYHRILAVIFMAGILQLVLTICGAARFSYMLPSSAIRGMMCSIGILIMAKQIPNFLGENFRAHDFFPIIIELPQHVRTVNWTVLGIAAGCLALLCVMPKINWKALRYIPAQLIVVLVGIAAGQLLHLDSRFLVHIPDNPLAKSFVMPDFGSLFLDYSCWGAALVALLALTFVDGTESLATIHAVDKIDPYKRKSNPKRTLFAMGMSNIVSSLVGGLTIIPGIIKSTTCIVSGGRTPWVNFYNAIFLIIFLLFATPLINMIPIGALAAVLVHIGYKLAAPKVWLSVAEIGREQLAIFGTTILVTLCTDLLLGIVAGVLVKIVVLLAYSIRRHRLSRHPLRLPLSSIIAGLFRNPVKSILTKDGVMTIELARPLTCFNSLALRNAVDHADPTIQHLRLLALPEVTIVDHSTNSYLRSLQEQWRSQGKLAEVCGLDNLRKITAAEECMRYKLAVS